MKCLLCCRLPRGLQSPTVYLHQTCGILTWQIFPKDYVKGAVVGDEEVVLLLEVANWAPTHVRKPPAKWLT